jgi:hypothetical protein
VLNWSLPALAAVVVGGSVVFAVAGVAVFSRLHSERVLKGTSALGPIFSAAATMFAVFMAFLVVIVYQRYAAATEEVREEASVVATLYRETGGLPIAEQTQMRLLLRRYTETVINDEWVTQRHGVSSLAARKDFDDLFRVYSNLKPAVASSPLNSQFATVLSVMGNDRNKRVLSSEEALPSILWVGLIAAAVILVSMSFLLEVEGFWPHVFLSGSLAAIIGVLLLLALVLNHPFRGQAPISPAAFRHTLSVFDSVDMGR